MLVRVSVNEVVGVEASPRFIHVSRVESRFPANTIQNGARARSWTSKMDTSKLSYVQELEIKV